LLRDHAPPQPPGRSASAAKEAHADGAHLRRRRADGAPVRPRRARVGPLLPDDAWLAAAPPASAAADADTRHLGSSAGSNAAARTGAHTPCANKSAAAVDAVCDNGLVLAYAGNSPRELRSPKGQPGENALTFSLGAFSRPPQRSPAQLYFRAESDREGNGLRKGLPKETAIRRVRDREGNCLRKERPRRRSRTRRRWISANVQEWLSFFARSQVGIKGRSCLS
jgi:hypothetical protein